MGGGRHTEVREADESTARIDRARHRGPQRRKGGGRVRRDALTVSR
ncbi:hypothetical protein J2S54_006506 [Streptomyces sp. DSM 42143]|nr:hypothetical protein [Streptomyces sp. DSM 42143]MDQ0389686.1 hypothetical protein [Streptomyces sp. DSM 42143]